MQPADDELVFLTQAAAQYRREVGPCKADSTLRVQAAERGRVSLGDGMAAYKVRGRWVVRKADVECAINAAVRRPTEQTEAVAAPDDLLKKQFIAALGSGGRCVGDLKRRFGEETYDRISGQLRRDNLIETWAPQEIREEIEDQKKEIYKRDEVTLRTALRKVGPRWFGRVLSVTPGIAFAIATIGGMAMGFFLFFVVHGLITRERIVTLQWANPLFRWSLIALIAAILAMIYLGVLGEIAPGEGTKGLGPFKRAGGLLLSPLIMVLGLAVIIVLVVSKLVGISALIKAPRVWREARESPSDKLVVRRKINEAPPRLRHKISNGPIFLISCRWARVNFSSRPPLYLGYSDPNPSA